MIINTSFRGPGGLAAHVQRTDTNERVVLREDLSTGCALSCADAIADFATMGTALGTEKSLIHMSISPSAPVSAEQERHMLALIMQVYEVPADHPALVIMHEKPGSTGRPAHYHVIMPRCQSDGRLLRDAFYKIKNERIAIELSYDFRHKLTPGPNINSVREYLRVVRPDIADALANLVAPKRERHRATVVDKNFAQQHGTDLDEFDARVLAAWRAGAFNQGPKALAAYRLALARGDKALMVVDAVNGFAQSLLRVVNREAKRQGVPLHLKKGDLDATLSQLDGLTELPTARREIVRASVRRLGRQRQESISATNYLGVPSVMPPPPWPAAAKDDSGNASTVGTTLKADLEAITIWRREIVDRRKRAADKAWRSARIWRSRRLEKFVFWAASGAALACGAGLIASIGVGVFTSVYVIAKGRQRFREAEHASDEVRRSRSEIALEIDRYFTSVRAARAFDLKEIPHTARVAVGHIFVEAAGGRHPRPDVVAALDRIRPALADKVVAVAQHSPSEKLCKILRSMYPPDTRHADRALHAFVSGASSEEQQRLAAARRRGRDGPGR